MIALPTPRRPAPGGGLAVLVVVTILAALAAGHPATVRAELHQRRWLPTGQRLPIPATGPAGPHAAGRGRRPPADPGVVPAHRPFLVRQGHPAGLQPLSVARRRPRPGRRPPGQPRQPRAPTARAVGRPRPGRRAAERGWLALALRGSALVHRPRPPGAPAYWLCRPNPARW